LTYHAHLTTVPRQAVTCAVRWNATLQVLGGRAVRSVRTSDTTLRGCTSRRSMEARRSRVSPGGNAPGTGGNAPGTGGNAPGKSGVFEERAGRDTAWPLGASNISETSENTEASTSTRRAEIGPAETGAEEARGGTPAVCGDSIGRLPHGVVPSCGRLRSGGAGSVPRRSKVASSWPRVFAVCVHANGAWSRQLAREPRPSQ